MSKKCVKPQLRFVGFEEDWEQRKLALFAEFLSGNGLNWNDISADGKQECILYGNLYTDYGIIVDTVIYKTNSKIQNPVYSEFGDVLIPASDTTSTGLARATSLEKSGVLLGSDINIIRPKAGINGSCLSLAINANKKELIKLIKGSTVRHIHNSEIKNIEIYLPKLESEQFKLSNYFKNIEHLIAIHQSKYEKLTNLKRSMLEKMFPKNGSNVPEIRFKGFSDAWERYSLSEIATMHARIGWQNLRTSEFLDSGEYMLITGTDFEDGTVNYSTCHYVERERYEQDKHIQIRNGSILITKDGTLGKVAFIQDLSMPATLNAGVFHIENKDKNTVDNQYLFQYLKAPFLMDYVDKKATGGTIKHLNQNILVDFPVVLPKKAEQERIGKYFLELDKLITLHQCKLEKLKNIKKACMKKMFV